MMHCPSRAMLSVLRCPYPKRSCAGAATTGTVCKAASRLMAYAIPPAGLGVVCHTLRWPSMVCGTVSTNSWRSEEHTSELQSRENLVCRLLLEKKKQGRGAETGVHRERV